MRALIAALVLTLAACVSTEMKSYVGKDIREVMLVSGQPIAVMDMGGGVRAFQFMWGGSSRTGVTSNSSTKLDSSVWLGRTSIESSGSALISSGCVISYLTKWSDANKGWVVTGYRYPKQLVC